MRVVYPLMLALFASAVVPAHAFDFADARRLVAVSEPQISPDGKHVAYVRSIPDFSKDRTQRQLMIVEVSTRRERPLTFDRTGVGSPQWSPDGSRLAFIADAGTDKDKESQVFTMRMDGGDAQQITTAKTGVINYAWSPDGSRFVYAAQDEDPNQKKIDAHDDAFEVHDNDYLHRTATPPVHAWIVSTIGGKARRLTSGTWSIADVDPDGGADFSWSPDGRTLAIERYPTPFYGDSLGSDVEAVDVPSGRLRPLTSLKGEDRPLFAPHGDAIVYARNTNGDYANGVALMLTSLHGGNGTDVHRDVDRDVEDYRWDASGRALWILTPDGSRQTLWYRPANGRAARVATGDIQPVALGNVARDGTLALVADTPSHPPEIYVLAGPASKPAAVTNANAFVARTTVARSVPVDWASTKGTFHEDGILTYPAGVSAIAKPYPLVLLIHGGPQSASTIGWSTRRQLFASRGYLVFEPNYRGSTNLGDAYQHAIALDAGDGPGKDVMAGIARVEKMVPVDTSRIGVSGWSYGGYMTSWLIGHYDIWKAAVSGASLDDWFDDFNVAFYTYTDVPYFPGVPSNPKYTAMWRAQSPITYAANAKTPTLIMGDIGDPNVTITNSFKLYHALKDNGTTVQFVAYPVGGHYPSDPVRAEDVTRRWLAWLDRYLK